jgi:hypothetical protein
MSDQPTSFWTTLPGILTGLAGLIAAVSGLITVLFTVGVLGSAPAKTPAATENSVTQTVVVPTVSQNVAKEPAKATALESSANQNVTLESVAKAEKAVNDLMAKSTAPSNEGGKIAFEMIVDGKTIPVQIDPSAASVSSNALYGNWRRFEQLLDLPQDIYLVLNTDGTAMNWVVNEGKTQGPRKGKWEVADGKLVFEYDGFPQESEAYSLYEGQLVYPDVAGRRQFWDKVETASP